jgi:hypothetical protein
MMDDVDSPLPNQTLDIEPRGSSTKTKPLGMMDDVDTPEPNQTWDDGRHGSS